MAAPDPLPTVELAGKTLPCYREGEKTFILYSSLVKEFQLADSSSLSTQQRRKNRVAGTDQHCPSGHLQRMKDAGVVAKAARNVAVLTTEQAHQLLQLYSVPGEAEMADAGVELQASGGNRDSLIIEDTDDEQPVPPPPKAARLARSMQLDVELHPDVGQQLKEMTSFWTKELNHRRGAQALSKSTMDKTRERLLTFLGFLDGQTQYAPRLDYLNDLQTVDMFLNFLKEERKRKPGTLAGYCQALTRGLKYLAAAQGMETNEAQAYVRALTTSFQREAAATQKTWQQLSWENKWLHWEEVLKVVRAQQELYETQLRPMDRAAQSQKYMALLLYTAVPPGRAKEYRTLKLQRHAGPFQSTGQGPSNILHYGPNVTMLQVGEYKNSKYMGVQNIDLSTIDYLECHLEDYLERDRPLLLRGNTDLSYVFVDEKGQAFTESGWTRFIQGIFEYHSGRSLGPNGLRSAFVTFLMDGQVEASPDTQRAVAHAMRHSTRYQRQVYDRRTTMDKSARAVKMTSTITGRTLDSNPTANLDEDGDTIPEPGDIVALVQEGSTQTSPLILLGQVLRVNLHEQEVLLAHLQEIDKSKYRLRVGQSTWTESFNSLVYPVDVAYDAISGMYTLRSEPLEIHKTIRKN